MTRLLAVVAAVVVMTACGKSGPPLPPLVKLPAAPANVDMSTFADQQIVRWKSFDGRTISGILSLPPARFAGLGMTCFESALN